MGLLSFLLNRLGAKRRRRLTSGLLAELPAEQRAFTIEKLLTQPVTVETAHGRIRFLNLGRGSFKRARTLLTKEPDSLKWIDRMAPGSVFWDIGANVGALTLYAAMRRDLEVWGFEPAAVNYYGLAANCELNGLDGEVRCLQLGFGDTTGIRDLHVSQIMPARSFTFRPKQRKRRTPERQKSYPARQPVPVWTIDDFVAHYAPSLPNYLKIDVPGLTPEILLGARRTLSDPSVREIQIEASEHGHGGRRVAELLEPLGFEIVHRNRRTDGTSSGDLVYGRVRPPVGTEVAAASL